MGYGVSGALFDIQNKKREHLNLECREVLKGSTEIRNTLLIAQTVERTGP